MTSAVLLRVVFVRRKGFQERRSVFGCPRSVVKEMSPSCLQDMLAKLHGGDKIFLDTKCFFTHECGGAGGDFRSFRDAERGISA